MTLPVAYFPVTPVDFRDPKIDFDALLGGAPILESGTSTMALGSSAMTRGSSSAAWGSSSKALSSSSMAAGSQSMLDPVRYAQIQVSANNAGSIIRAVSRPSFEERLFDSLVSLKVAVSQYAMHLPSDERRRIFDRLDSVINVDDWHEEDNLPILNSFRDFLKWMIYAKRFNWSSIGVSNEGKILVAWSVPQTALTAEFDGQNNVTWTATVTTEKVPAHAVGTCSLRQFAQLEQFYLGVGAA